MLDIKLIRENPEKINELLKRRNSELSIDKVLEIDSERRKIPIMIKKDILDVEGFLSDDPKCWKYVMIIAFLSIESSGFLRFKSSLIFSGFSLINLISNISYYLAFMSKL